MLRRLKIDTETLVTYTSHVAKPFSGGTEAGLYGPGFFT
jgi:hypothetical protein